MAISGAVCPSQQSHARALTTRFRRCENGVTMIEFGMVAFPFLLFVLGIMAVGLQFFTINALDHAVETASRKIRTGAIYTMNLDEAVSVVYGYKALYASTEMGLGMIFGSSETLCCYDTYQFPDYSKVEMGLFDPEKKAVRRRDVFPEDCRKAFQLGCRMVSGQNGELI